MIISIILILLTTAASAHVIAGPEFGLTKRGIVYEADCDDAQDNAIHPAMFDVQVLSNNILDEKLPDGTPFSGSTA